MSDGQHNGNECDIFQGGETPDVSALDSLFSTFSADCAKFAERAAKNAKTRLCEWSGRSEDCRKWGSERKPAFPWNGASDVRPFTVDALINENVAHKINAMRLGAITAVPIGVDGSQTAGTARELIQWLTSPSKMREFRAEIVKCANWSEESGLSVLGFYWERVSEVRWKTVFVGDILGVSLPVAGYVRAVKEPVDDDGNLLTLAEIERTKRAAVASLAEFYGIEKLSEAEKLLDSCVERGAGQYPSVETVVDKPRVRAFRVGNDIFFPPDIDDIQNAPAVFTLEFLHPHELRSRIHTDEWDEKFVEAVIGSSADTSPSEENAPRPSGTDSDSSDGYENTVKIATAYYRSHDKDGNVSLRFAIFAPDNTEAGAAKAGTLDFEPSRLPFELCPREEISRRVADARGTPEIAFGWQRDIKTQRDARNDKTAIEANPPRYYIAGRAPTAYGPGAMIPLRTADVNGIVREAPITPMSQSSLEIERSANAYAGAYFGKKTDFQTQTEADALRQMMVDTFLDFVSRVYAQIYWLHRQYGPDVERIVFRSGGGYREMDVERDRLPDRYSFYISFDARNGDLDFVVKKAKVALDVIAQLDRSGRVNTDAILDSLLRYLYPDCADRLVSSEADSDRREVLETQADIAKIASGQGVNAPEKANVDLRLQVVEAYVSQPDVASRLQSDEFFANRLQAYMRQLQFQRTQAQNAVIGRIGAAPQQFEHSNFDISQNG